MGEITLADRQGRERTVGTAEEATTLRCEGYTIVPQPPPRRGTPQPGPASAERASAG